MKSKSDKSRIFKNSIIVISATILEKAFFFVISILLARYLNIDQYGEYTTALEYATFFSIFTNIGINQALIRAINIERHYENEHFTNNLIIKTFLAIIIYILLAVSLLFTNYNTNTISLILIFGFVRIGNEFLLSFYALNDAKEQFRIQAIFTSLFSLSFLSSTIVIILFKGNYFHIAYVRSALVLLFLLIIIIMTLKHFNLKFNYQKLKHFIKQTIPFTMAIIYSNIIQRANIIILSLMHGTIYTGIFNNGYLFYITLFFIPINLHRVLLPYLYKIPYKNNYDRFQFAFDIFSKYLSIISFYFLLVILIFSKDIIFITFGNKYIDSINVLKILSIGIPFMFSLSLTFITALDEQKVVTNIRGITVIINIIANFILIFLFRSEGAAASVVITMFLTFLFAHIYLKKKKGFKLKNIIIIFVKLILIIIYIYLLFVYLLKDQSLIFNLIIINLLFFISVYLSMINRNDIRIIKETLGIR